MSKQTAERRPIEELLDQAIARNETSIERIHTRIEALNLVLTELSDSAVNHVNVPEPPPR